MEELSSQTCIPCRGDEPTLGSEEIDLRQNEVPDWEVVEVKSVQRLRRRFKFPDFAKALSFTDRVGALAQAQKHHPRIITQWGSVTVDWWTHAISGLHNNDFIMAAKTDAAAVE